MALPVCQHGAWHAHQHEGERATHAVDDGEGHQLPRHPRRGPNRILPCIGLLFPRGSFVSAQPEPRDRERRRALFSDGLLLLLGRAIPRLLGADTQPGESGRPSSRPAHRGLLPAARAGRVQRRTVRAALQSTRAAAAACEHAHLHGGWRLLRWREHLVLPEAGGPHHARAGNPSRRSPSP